MKVILRTGKRKKAIAKATMKDGKGIVRINSQLLENYQPEIARMKIQEPLMLTGDQFKKFNFDVKVQGGGWMSQADASRLAIARCLVETNKNLKKTFLDYDRHLLIQDSRHTEASKPNDSKPRAKRQKSKR
ncbi:MAG: 30S ribosomal protein S9 [Candidatus Woesearchaeota archaeon]